MKFKHYKEPVSFTTSYIAECNGYDLKIYQDCCGWSLNVRKAGGGCYIRHFTLRNYHYKANLLREIDDLIQRGDAEKVCNYRWEPKV